MLRSSRRGWTVTAIATLVAVPVLVTGLVAVWIDVTLFSTERYVELFAPLAEDPRMESFLLDEVRSRVETAVDLPALPLVDTAEIEERITRFAVDRARDLIRSEGSRVLWRTALRAGHERFMALIDDPDADGRLHLEVDWIADRVEDAPLPPRLLAPFVRGIREQQPIVLFNSPWLAAAQRGARWIHAAALALPWAGLALLGTSIAFAPERWTALALVGAALLAAAAVLWLVPVLLRPAVIGASALPEPVTALFWERALTGVHSALGAIAAAGVLFMAAGAIGRRSRRAAASS